MGRRKNSFSPVSEPETVETQADEVTEVVEEVTADTVVTESPATEPETVPDMPIDALSNPGRNVMRIGGIVIAPGGTRKLTDKDRADERSMKKIEHMVKLGVLHRGNS